ncbi:MAG: hypothetical protein A4E28_02720 [Methanocella sp. PtaU1.Bin125]|nr:MAG: hypothetical protein A4E28_02720 [Methanocella sp. PtaU1.Bin125]
MASIAGDDRAADTIPIALVATVLVIAIMTGLAAFGLTNAAPAVQMAAVDRQVGVMANDCRLLLSMAPRNLDDPCSPQGAFRLIALDLPDGLEYLSFGYDPDSGGGHRGTIYYAVCGTKKALIVDESAVFRTAGSGRTMPGPGRYELCIEYARDAPGHRYLLVSAAA